MKSLRIATLTASIALAACLAGCGGASSSAASSASVNSTTSDTSASSVASTSSTISTDSTATSTTSSAVSTTSATSTASTTSTTSATSVAEDPGAAEYQRAVALFDEGKFYSAKQAFEASKYQDWEQRAAACVQPLPETGVLWRDETLQGEIMGLAFDVHEDDENTCTYLEVYTADHKRAAAFFIKGTGEARAELPGGNYYIKDATGTEWYGETEMFGPDGHYENMVFDEFEGDRYLTALDAGADWVIGIQTGSNEGQDVGAEDISWGSWN